MIVYLMGVSGCGKSTVGEGLATALEGAIYLDGDDFHPPANKHKMAAGSALDDADRWPWFDVLKKVVAEKAQRYEPVLIACSALKRAYRDYLRNDDPDNVRFVWLDGSRELIESRLVDRHHEYMPASLLDSQFATLEKPTGDEGVLRVEVDQEPEAIVEEILRELGLGKTTDYTD